MELNAVIGQVVVTGLLAGAGAVVLFFVFSTTLMATAKYELINDYVYFYSFFVIEVFSIHISEIEKVYTKKSYFERRHPLSIRPLLYTLLDILPYVAIEYKDLAIFKSTKKIYFFGAEKAYDEITKAIAAYKMTQQSERGNSNMMARLKNFLSRKAQS